MLPQIAAAAVSFGSSYAKHKAAETAVRSVGNVLTRASYMLKEGQSIRSLADLSRPARVEPIVIVEENLRDVPEMVDVMKTLSSMFIGYYMQAAVYQGVKIGSISPLKVFDQLNPERVRRDAQDVIWSKESYEDGIPSFEDFHKPIESPHLVVSVESKDSDQKSKTPPSLSVGDADTSKFYEIPNLVVGKLINIELQDGDHKGKFPVMIRLTPTSVKTGVLTHIFTGSSKDTSMKEQYHLWRAGQISFWKDLVFSTNLIDQHRKVLVNDTSNVYSMMTDRRRNNYKAGAVGKSPSMADASNILVVTKETARTMGRALHGRLEDVRIRQRFFDSNYLLLLAVVDELHSRVVIYHRGYDRPTEASFNEIKGSEKNKGADISEILKAYVVGSTPSV